MHKFTPHDCHSIRLKDHDYSKSGAYFITTCAYRYEMSFDEPEIYKTIEAEWFGTTNIRPDVGPDESVIMPNHVHGIIVIKSYYKSCNNGVWAYGYTPLHLKTIISVLIWAISCAKAQIKRFLSPFRLYLLTYALLFNPYRYAPALRLIESLYFIPCTRISKKPLM